MNRRTLLQALATTPLAFLLPGARAAKAEHRLHIWRSEDNDYVIAHSAEDAAAVWRESTGNKDACDCGDFDGADHWLYGARASDWTKWFDDKPFTRIDREPDVLERFCVKDWDGYALKPVTAEDTRLGWLSQRLSFHGSSVSQDDGPSYELEITALPAWWCAREGRGFFSTLND